MILCPSLASSEDFHRRKEAFLDGTLNWVSSNIEGFDPTADNGNHRLRLKALSELLFTSSLYKRRFGSFDPPFNRFVSYGIGIVNRMSYDRMHRKPELLIPYSIIYDSMRECGVDSNALREVIQSMLDIGLPLWTEDNPYRKMELRYAFEKGSFRYELPPLEALYRNSSISTVPPALYLRLGSVYDLTHAVFYLTDFGFSKRHISDLAPMLSLISTLLGMYTMEGNWDVVAELLLCCNFLDYFPGSTYQNAWSSLIKAQNNDGSISDIFFDAKKYEEMGILERQRYYFDQHYHTVLVSAAVGFLTSDGNMMRRDALDPRPEHSIADCKKQIEKAHDWILETYVKESGRLDLASMLYVLLGDWIWGFSTNDYFERSRSLYIQIHDDFRKMIRSHVSIFECDPAIVLLAEGVLRKFNLRVADFELLASSSRETLSNCDDSVTNHSLHLFPILHLLQSLGSGLDWHLPADESKDVKFDYESGAPEDRLGAIVNYVSTVTSFGSCQLPANESRNADNVRANLAALTFFYLHRYKLNEGLMLIRAMNHAGMNSSKPFKEAVDFILSQQRKDGSFGFYEDEISQIRKSVRGYDPLKEIILPTTFSAIWTLAEATVDGFSLFNSIRL